LDRRIGAHKLDYQNKNGILKKLEKGIEMVPVSSHFLGIAKFFAYLVGSDELIQMIEDGPLTHTSTLIALFLRGFLFHLCLV
jgi:hypothetical protein